MHPTNTTPTPSIVDEHAICWPGVLDADLDPEPLRRGLGGDPPIHLP